MHPHLPGDVRQDLVPVVELDSELRVGERVGDDALRRVLAQAASSGGIGFGLHGYENSTLEQVANELGVTRERVRQVQIAALVRLREISNQEGVSEMPYSR